MGRKLIVLALAAVMAFGVFGLAACDSVSLAEYKAIKSTELQTYADARSVGNYSESGWAAICNAVTEGKKAIEDATTKPAVDTAVSTAKEKIRAVQTNNTFPSNLENFDLEEFTDEFFENNTLILVPFAYSYLLYEHLDFYTVSIADGKMNFYIEVTDPNGGGDEAIDYRLFAVIIEKEVYGRYELGEKIIFTTYDFNAGNVNNPPFELPPPNDRDWLIEIQGNSIEHRVGFLSRDSFKPIGNSIVSVSSRQGLNGLLV